LLWQRRRPKDERSLCHPACPYAYVADHRRSFATLTFYAA